MEANQSTTDQNLTETAIQQQAITNNNRSLVIVAICILLTAIITGSAVYFWQKSANEKMVNSLKQKVTSLEGRISTMKRERVIPQPTLLVKPSLVPTNTGLVSPQSPTTNPTSDWKTYNVLGSVNQKLSVIYKLSVNVNEPKWVNAGRYYKANKLPGGTTLAIIPVGENMGYQYTWEELIDKIVNNYSQEKIKFTNFPTAIRFSGKISSFEQAANLLILGGQAAGEFQGVIAKVDNDLSLYVLLYQDTFNGEKDFSSDKVLFNQILSTFKLTD